MHEEVKTDSQWIEDNQLYLGDIVQRYTDLEKYEFRIDNNLNNANHIHDFGLYIGNHPELEDKQIINLCEKLNEIKL